MIEVGIFPNDILIVDRSLTAKEGDIVIASVQGDFTVKKLGLKPLRLIPCNAKYSPIMISDKDDFTLFGVVVHSVRAFR